MLIFAVLASMMFLTTTLTAPVLASTFSLIEDPSYECYLDEWGKSYTWLGNVYWWWYSSDNGYWKVKLDDSSKWNHVGLFQGTAPFGWGQAPHYWDWPGIHEDTPQYMYWRGMLDYSHLWWGHWDAQTNVGVDLWFNIWHPDLGWAVAELFVFFDQNGMFSHSIGSWWDQYRSDDGHSWWEICHHEGNLKDDEYKSFYVDVDALIDEAKSHISNPYYRESTWYLCDVLNCLEGKKAEAVAYFQYLYYLVN